MNSKTTQPHIHDVHALSKTTIDKRLNDAEHQCRQAGVRFTSLRRNVYRLVLAANKPLGAYDLIQMLQSNRSETEGNKAKMVAPPTIYRTLDFLLQQGFIHQLTSINAFIPCCHPRETHNAVFLLCTQCHRVQECSGLPVQKLTDYVNTELHFAIAQSVMELKGHCQGCLKLDSGGQLND